MSNTINAQFSGHVEGKSPQDNSDISMTISFTVSNQKLADLTSGKVVNVDIHPSDVASSITQSGEASSFFGQVIGPSMTRAVIPTDGGPRFVNDGFPNSRLRLSSMTPASDEGPERQEIDLSPYVGKRITFRRRVHGGNLRMETDAGNDEWVYGVDATTIKIV